MYMSNNLYLAGFFIALSIAAIYFKFWPKPINAQHNFARPVILRGILRWAHGAVWLVLALVFAGLANLVALEGRVIEVIGWSAFGLYGIFVIACFYDRTHLAGRFK